jgi:hypothetical protein
LQWHTATKSATGTHSFLPKLANRRRGRVTAYLKSETARAGLCSNRASAMTDRDQQKMPRHFGRGNRTLAMKEIASALAGRKRNSRHSEMIRRLRLAHLRKLLRDRNGPILPDDDAGREYLLELLLPISIGPHADIKMPNAIEVWAPWMQKDEATQLIDHINRMPIWERKPTAKTLGQRLNLTNPDRERLKLWTIAPSDMGEQGMAWWRKHKDKQRKRRLRQLRGAKSQATSISKSKPWLELGIKRSTWYSQYRWTTSSEVKLISSKDKTVQAEKRRVSEEGVAAKRASPTSTVHLVQQEEKTQMPATDTALEFNGRNYPSGEEQNGNDLRGMPRDLSKFYPATPTYEWLNSDRAAA